MVKSACRVLVPALSAVLLTLVAGCDSGTPGRSSPPSAPPPPAASVAAPPAAAAAPIVLAQWSPDAALLDKLDEYRDLEERFEVRVPKWWNADEDSKALGNAKVLSWKGAERADGGYAVLSFTFASNPGHELQPAQSQLESLVKLLSNDASDLKVETVEYGTINGLKFVRARYQFTQAANSLKVHGLIYVHWEGPLLCEISMEDIEPGYEESEDICTASVLTFRKKK